MPVYYPAKEVVDRLWVGSKGDALSKSFFEVNNIRYVVNCSTTIPFNPHFQQIEGLRVPVEDRVSDNILMLEHIPFAVDAIMSAMKSDKKHAVLIHCLAGQQRSATIAACVLMKTKKMNVQQAIEYIRRIKSECFTPYPTFQQAMEAYYVSIIQ
jgi:dual specificity MAP kinase phosphatase